MLVRRLVAAVVVVAGALTVPAIPSYAADAVTDLYVATAANGGDDAHDCTQAAPCATVQRAMDLAADAGTTIHIGSGTFDGQVVQIGKSVALQGVSSDDTVLTNTYSDIIELTDFDVLDLGAGTTNLSRLAVSGGFAANVLVYGTGQMTADHVAVTDSLGCGVGVLAGAAVLIDSIVSDPGQASCHETAGGTPLQGGVALETGSLSLVRSQVLVPEDVDGVRINGGSVTLDQTLIQNTAGQDVTNNASGVDIEGGTATVSRTAIQAFGTGVLVKGGTALLKDDTFQGNVVGVTGDSGSTTVVRSTFEGELAALQSTVAIAGSVLGQDSITNCANATITDLGYNLSTDDSCGLTAGTSRQNVDDLDLDTGLADRGGPPFLHTVATFSPSAAVDYIPEGATYGDQATLLCPLTGSTDLRGLPRPVGDACDAGSMELAGTTTALAAPNRARPHHEITLTATVAVPDVGVDGIGVAAGAVTFRSGSQVLCTDVPVSAGTASCTTSALSAGRHSLTASFTPADDAVIHGSVSVPHQVIVGTKPSITAPRRFTVHVGQRVHIALHASGAPRPILRKIAGHLPRGLTFHRGVGKATITGRAKASAVGTHHIKVRARNLVGQDRHRLTVVVVTRR